MTEDELSSAVDFFHKNKRRSYRYIREYPSSTTRNNRSYPEQVFESVDRTSRMDHPGLGTISRPTKITTVACDSFNNSYRIIELDKDAILQLIENAITKGKISPKDIILLFAKLKESKSDA